MKNYSENPEHYKRLIAQINSESDFPGFLIAEGYRLLKKSSGSQEFGKGTERIVLLIKRNPITYFNRNDSSDKGHFFKYLHIRSANFYEAVKQGLGVIQREYFEPFPIKVPKKADRPISLEERYDIRPLTRPHYVTEERMLSMDTLTSEAFNDRIFNAFHVNDNRGRIANIALPKYSLDGSIKNYTLFNKPYRDRKDGRVKKFRLFLNERYEFLFVSDPEISPEKMVVVESGFDALAYHELHGCPKNFYISMSGHIDHKKLEQCSKWYEAVCDDGSLAIHLAFDFDIEGMRYDLALLVHWMHRNPEGPSVEMDWKRPVMRLTLNYPSASPIVMERDTEYINSHIRESSDAHPKGFKRATRYRDRVVWEMDLQGILESPQARKLWQSVVESLSNRFTEKKLRMDKSPSMKDWNDELISVRKTRLSIGQFNKTVTSVKPYKNSKSKGHAR